MERFRCTLKRLFFLPPLATVLIALPSFAFVFWGLATELDGALAYLSYGLSAYAVVIVLTGAPRIARAMRSAAGNHTLVRKMRDHPFGVRYLTDAAFRVEVSLYPSLCINLLYAAMKMFSGIFYGSMWFLSLSVYYSLLAVMRFLLLTSARKKRPKTDIAAEYKRYRACGVLLAIMTLALSGMVLFIVRQDDNYHYPGVLIYVMAMYAFYAVITAIINIVKFRKHGSPVLSAAKAINLTAALVSMLALETAMITQFGDASDQFFRQVMTASTGAVVCILVLGMAIYMIGHAAIEMKKISQ